jgi:DNA invertase Pin-like site-specific DNA recombinase
VRTVVYARYSSQLQSATSIEDQIAACRSRAEREGWTIVDVFTDYAISGAAGIAEAQRPGLNALLARVEAGGIDQVLADSTSRIARHQGDAHAIRERVQFAGARLFTLADGEIDDIKGLVKGFLDSQQRRDLAHNIRRGQRGTVAAGRVPAGIAYGYRRANRLDERGELVRGLREIDPDQAAIVVRIFTEYAAGRSAMMIARDLNRDGIPSPRGDGWRASVINGDRTRGNGMLINRLYAGVIVHNRTRKVVNPSTRKVHIKPNPPSEWVTHDAPELRIVPPALFEAVQTRFAEGAGRRPELQRRPKRLLSGLGVCGVCGSNWIVIGVERWGCGGRKDGKACSNTRQVGTARYEAETLAQLRDSLLSPEAVAAYVREYHRAHMARAADGARERATLERKLAEAQRKVARLVDAVAAGGREFAEIRDLLAAARDERDACERRIAELEAMPVIALHPGLADQYRREVDALHEALAGHEAARLEAIPRLRALIHRVVVRPAEQGRGVSIEVEGRIDQVVDVAHARRA